MNIINDSKEIVNAVASYAAQVNAELQAFENASRKALGHAKKAGDLLTEIKSELPHGEFSKWLDKNFKSSRRTAQRFMKIAANWDTLEAKTPRVSLLSLREAERIIAKPKQLEAVERCIDIDTFQTVAESLRAVRDRELYRHAGHATFDAYVLHRFGLSLQLVGDLLDIAAQVEGGQR